MRKLYIFSIIAASLAVLAGFFAVRLDVFRTVPPINADACVHVNAPKLGGTEDLSVFEGVLFVSADYYRREAFDKSMSRDHAETTGRNMTFARRQSKEVTANQPLESPNYDDFVVRLSILDHKEQGEIFVYPIAHHNHSVSFSFLFLTLSIYDATSQLLPFISHSKHSSTRNVLVAL